MANECRIEFYFKRELLEKMLNDHSKATGVIISQEIKREKPRGSMNFVNITHIKARMDYGKKAPPKTAKKLMGGTGDDGGDGSVDGCPYPPGCTP